MPAAAPAPRRAAQSAAPPTAKTILRRALAIHLALTVVVLGRMRGVVPGLLMTVLIVQSRFFRKARWQLFGMLMAAWLLAILIMQLSR